MFEKHLWKSDILSKDASHRCKNQLPGFYISGTLVKTWLKTLTDTGQSWKKGY